MRNNGENSKSTDGSVHVSSTEVLDPEPLELVVPSPKAGFRSCNVRLLFSCGTFAASAMAFGYDDKLISPIAALESFIIRYQGFDKTSKTQVFTAYNQDLLFSLPLLGALIGAALAALLNNHLGRKKPLLIAYVLSLAGAVLQLFAPTLGAFVVGRLGNAIAMGIATTTAPLYLSEVVPHTWRGMAVTTSNALNLLSGVIATVVVNATHTRTGRTAYAIPLAVQCCAPILLIPITFWVPESPQWLISKGRTQEARSQLRLLRKFPDPLIDEELHVMELCEHAEQELNAGVTWKHLFTGQNTMRTITAGSVFSLNQVSGIILSTTYATVFLVDLGVADPFTLTIIGSSSVLAGTVVAPLVIDKLGRRYLALSGMIILLVIDIVAGGLAFNSTNPKIALGIAALSFLFNFVWAVSFYSLSILLPAEIATPKLRNMTMSYSIICAYITAIATTFAVPLIVSSDGAGLGAKTYLMFAGFMTFIIVFFYIFLPETSRRSFAEIDEMYYKKIPMRKWRTYSTSTVAKFDKH